MLQVWPSVCIILCVASIDIVESRTFRTMEKHIQLINPYAIENIEPISVHRYVSRPRPIHFFIGHHQYARSAQSIKEPARRHLTSGNRTVRLPRTHTRKRPRFVDRNAQVTKPRPSDQRFVDRNAQVTKLRPSKQRFVGRTAKRPGSLPTLGRTGRPDQPRKSRPNDRFKGRKKSPPRIRSHENSPPLVRRSRQSSQKGFILLPNVIQLKKPEPSTTKAEPPTTEAGPPTTEAETPSTKAKPVIQEISFNATDIKSAYSQSIKSVIEKGIKHVTKNRTFTIIIEFIRGSLKKLLGWKNKIVKMVIPKFKKKKIEKIAQKSVIKVQNHKIKQLEMLVHAGQLNEELKRLKKKHKKIPCCELEITKLQVKIKHVNFELAEHMKKEHSESEEKVERIRREISKLMNKKKTLVKIKEGSVKLEKELELKLMENEKVTLNIEVSEQVDTFKNVKDDVVQTAEKKMIKIHVQQHKFESFHKKWLLKAAQEPCKKYCDVGDTNKLEGTEAESSTTKPDEEEPTREETTEISTQKVAQEEYDEEVAGSLEDSTTRYKSIEGQTERPSDEQEPFQEETERPPDETNEYEPNLEEPERLPIEADQLESITEETDRLHAEIDDYDHSSIQEIDELPESDVYMPILEDEGPSEEADENEPSSIQEIDELPDSDVDMPVLEDEGPLEEADEIEPSSIQEIDELPDSDVDMPVLEDEGPLEEADGTEPSTIQEIDQLPDSDVYMPILEDEGPLEEADEIEPSLEATEGIREEDENEPSSIEETDEIPDLPIPEDESPMEEAEEPEPALEETDRLPAEIGEDEPEEQIKTYDDEGEEEIPIKVPGKGLSQTVELEHSTKPPSPKRMISKGWGEDDSIDEDWDFDEPTSKPLLNSKEKNKARPPAKGTLEWEDNDSINEPSDDVEDDWENYDDKKKSPSPSPRTPVWEDEEVPSPAEESKVALDANQEKKINRCKQLMEKNYRRFVERKKGLSKCRGVLDEAAQQGSYLDLFKNNKTKQKKE